MRNALSFAAVLALSSSVACSEKPSPEAVKNAQIREEIESSISELETKTRTKARGLGMGNADTATIDDARAYVCNALVGQLKEKKDAEGRLAIAADLNTYACRERDEWLAALRDTAKDQGMNGAGNATLNEARDHVCDRIKESLRAVKKESDKAALEVESKVYDCILR